MMMIPVFEKWLIGMALLVGLFGFGFYKGVHYEKTVWQAREDAFRAQAAEEYKAEVEKNSDLSAKLAASQAKTNTVYKTITNEVQHVIERPIYSQCVLDVDGIRLRDDAYRGTNSKPANTVQPDSSVPSTAAAKRSDDGKPSQ